MKARRRVDAHEHNCALKDALGRLYTSKDKDSQIVVHSQESNWVFMLVRADTEMGQIFLGNRDGPEGGVRWEEDRDGSKEPS